MHLPAKANCLSVQTFMAIKNLDDSDVLALLSAPLTIRAPSSTGSSMNGDDIIVKNELVGGAFIPVDL